MYASTKYAKKHYSVSSDTLRRWTKQGKIKFRRTKGMHRRYYIDKKYQKTKKRIIYARVSSSKQKSDLQNQIKYLQSKFPDYTTITDIGSGIDFKRKGFKTILDELFDDNIEEVMVVSKDRFVRFGFELFESIFDKFNAKLVAVKSDGKQFQEELAEDIITIITVFTAKYHGKREYIGNKNDEHNEKEISEKTVIKRKIIRKSNTTYDEEIVNYSKDINRIMGLLSDTSNNDEGIDLEKYNNIEKTLSEANDAIDNIFNNLVKEIEDIGGISNNNLKKRKKKKQRKYMYAEK